MSGVPSLFRCQAWPASLGLARTSRPIPSRETILDEISVTRRTRPSPSSSFFGHATHYDPPGGATKLDNVATVRIGDHELTRDQARDLIRDYTIRYRATVLWYDMAGDDTDRPDRASATQPVNTVTLADIGRLVAINADLRAGDVSALLTTASEQAFAEVPPDARLQDCPPAARCTWPPHCSMTCSAALASGRPSAPRCCTSSAHGPSRSMTATCTGYTRTEPPPSLSKSMTPAPAGGRLPDVISWTAPMISPG